MFTASVIALSIISSFLAIATNLFTKPQCRNTPGTPGFPPQAEWAALNSSLSGRLVPIVPTVKFCRSLPGGCTSQQLTSAIFRNEIPGSMCHLNWEQDFDSNPPSLCYPETKICGQGNIPLYAIAAESVNDIQIGVKFAANHNLRIAVKASGHDYLGRSTAKNALLIWTHKFQNISFTDNFIVGGTDHGPAVTLGSGVTLQDMYTATKAQGKIVVGGTAATVVAAGGYVQGGGHSATSPSLGLAADNCLELKVVLANGDLVTVNEVENSDLFWAMRGGGAGSWGVIASATFRTFPTFDAVKHTVTLNTNNMTNMGNIAMIHAKHIFDLDSYRVGQYILVSTTNFNFTGIPTTGPATSMIIKTFFPNTTVDQAEAAMKSLIDEISSAAGVDTLQHFGTLGNINDLLFSPDDGPLIGIGANLALGSRLVPESTYRDTPELIKKVYTQLLESGTKNLINLIVAGGQVAENAQISNAINPAWRTAKSHIFLVNTWPDTESSTLNHANEMLFTNEQLPILDTLSGPVSAAYSNEADPWEKDFQTVFFGQNYAKLSAIKIKYDPKDLFIVRAGVGSERWDSDGICRV